jgi:hypothetical protein
VSCACAHADPTGPKTERAIIPDKTAERAPFDEKDAIIMSPRRNFTDLGKFFLILKHLTYNCNDNVRGVSSIDAGDLNSQCAAFYPGSRSFGATGGVDTWIVKR